jgi:hypothetical protein
MLRMKVLLAAVGGILIGPFAGFLGMFWLCSVVPHHDCMWRFGALFGSIIYGGAAGMVTFGLIGFGVGFLLDKRAKRKWSDEGGSVFEP